FLMYFIPSRVVIFLMLERNEILQYMLNVMNSFFRWFEKLAVMSRMRLGQTLKQLNDQEFVYFTKGDDISILNKVMIYVQENEITRRLKIVTVLPAETAVSEDFLRDLEVLDRAYCLARELIAKTAPVSTAVIRQTLNRMSALDSPEGVFELDSRLIASCGDNPDAIEGIVSFLQRRPADFTGLVSRDQPDFLPWKGE
ncbi:MAG: hypothetical protein ACXWW1_11455, partial [Aeromicrobium sp.]